MRELKQLFTARIEKGPGGRAFVTLPFEPAAAWGPQARYNTTGFINEVKFRGPLEPSEGGFRLSLGPAWRRDAGLGPGDEVTVAMEPEGPQDGNMAQDLVDALAAEPAAREFFDSLATFYRKNYVRWVEEAKRPETRANRIREVVGLLKDRKRQR